MWGAVPRHCPVPDSEVGQTEGCKHYERQFGSAEDIVRDQRDPHGSDQVGERAEAGLATPFCFDGVLGVGGGLSFSDGKGPTPTRYKPVP